MALKGFGNSIQSSKYSLRTFYINKKILGVALAAYACKHIHGCTTQMIFAYASRGHLQTTQTLAEMHGEMGIPVDHAQRLDVVRGSRVQTGSLAPGSSVTATAEYFHNAAGGEGSAED